MGRRGYPPEFRRRVLELIEAGRKVAEDTGDLGIVDEAIVDVADDPVGPVQLRRPEVTCFGPEGIVPRQ